MTCAQSCTSANGLFSYSFFEDLPLTHQNARQICSERNSTLATNLTLEDYLAIDNCCTTPKVFRIGLVKRHDICAQPELYSWLTSSSCVNGTPLQINGIIPGLCQSIAIPVGSLNQSNFTVTLRNCSEHLPYICQTKIPSAPQNELAFDHTKDFLQDDYSAGTIAGVIVACVLVLFLAIFLVLCYLKKHDIAKLEPGILACKQVWCISCKTKNRKSEENKNVYDSVPSIQQYENVSAERFVGNASPLKNYENVNVYESLSNCSQKIEEYSSAASVNSSNQKLASNNYEDIDLNDDDASSKEEKHFVQEIEKSDKSQSRSEQTDSLQSKSATVKKSSSKATTALYAMVNKKSNKACAGNTAELYAVVDKTRKKVKNAK